MGREHLKYGMVKKKYIYVQTDDEYQRKKELKNKVEPNPVTCGAVKASILLHLRAKFKFSTFKTVPSPCLEWANQAAGKWPHFNLFSQEMLIITSLSWPLFTWRLFTRVSVQCHVDVMWQSAPQNRMTSHCPRKPRLADTQLCPRPLI